MSRIHGEKMNLEKTLDEMQSPKIFARQMKTCQEGARGTTKFKLRNMGKVRKVWLTLTRVAEIISWH